MTYFTSQTGKLVRSPKWVSVLGLILVILFSVTAVSAQTTPIVDASGTLAVTLSGQDDTQVTCINNQVKINGLDPSNGAFSCDQITAINIQGSAAANNIHLGGITAVNFPNLKSIIVDGKAGDDRITASEFSDTIFGGAGDDLFTGTQPDDQVNGGPGQNMFVEATQPLGPGPTAQGSDKPTTPSVPSPLAPGLINNFGGPDFDNNATLTGSYYIPPDPIAAAGPNHVVSVVNVAIQWHTKAGVQQNNQSLQTFFSGSSPAPTTVTFDPKVIYDQYEDRFVVVTLEKIDTGINPNAGNISRIYLAVSDDSNPAGTWYYQVIDAKVNTGGLDYWFDYPGFAVDEDVIYITGNMFQFVTNAGATFNQLWIIDKGAGSGGLYDGGTSATSSMNPAGAGFNVTYQPAHVFGSGGIPGAGPIGTFLVGYNGFTFGGPGANEVVSIIRVDDPVGTPTMSGSFVPVADLEDIGGVFGFPDLPDAPQNGTATLVEVNDRRTYQAVWRNNSLWATTSIEPNAGADTGQTTAHWWHLDTSAAPGSPVTLTDEGNIGGEDIATGAYTFFPSVAVDPCNNAGFGFAASESTIYPGAYYTNRYASDTAGIVQSTGTLVAGTDYYIRTFGTGRNRWGDYSGMALDPDNEATFWVFNEYAMTRGTAFGGEDGRWATEYGSFPSGIDFGDLPSSYTLTNFSDDGARHCIGGPYLGTTLTADGDGKEDPNALGDTDEGAVRQPSTNGSSTNGGWTEGNVSGGDGGRVDITVGGSSGTVQAFIDFGSGTLAATTLLNCSTGVALSMPLSVGTHQTCFDIAGSTFGAIPQPIRMRLRISTAGGLSTTGLAADGEVEDHSWNFGPTAVTLRDVEIAQSEIPPGWIIASFTLVIIGLLFWRKRQKMSA
ncbi:MAG: hypothetical protein GY796_00520 [Chloroflexi bacterium]|nr:hypothetical protein [Chloroflexota bacterium]